MKGRDAMGLYLDVTHIDPVDGYNSIEFKEHRNDRPELGERWLTIIFNGHEVATIVVDEDDATLMIDVMPEAWEPEDPDQGT